MKKISVITLISVYNYGSALQTFATQKIFERYGLKVSFVNYRRVQEHGLPSRIRAWVKNDGYLKKIIKSLILLPTLVRQRAVFSRFLKNFIQVDGPVYTAEEDFAHQSLDSDIYCTGSDQTWNSGWNAGILKPLFLSFVPDHVPKIAYAASFGKPELDEWEKGETHRLLQRYRTISVRESFGVDIIRDLGISQAVHVLDPTLQLDREFWMQYVGPSVCKEPYVLIYQLNSNPLFDAYAKEFARRKGLKLLRFCTRYDQFIKCGKPLLIPEVTGFISSIAHACYVITDSFHATAFCINLNVEFINIFPREYSTRLSSILRLVRLEERQLILYDDFSFVDAKSIDFKCVNKLLEAERQKGNIFLQQALTISE